MRNPRRSADRTGGMGRPPVEHEQGVAWAIIEAVGEPVCVHAPDGSIAHANPAAQRLLATLAGQAAAGPVAAADQQAIRPDGTPVSPGELPVEITRLTGEPCNDVQLGVLRADGTRCWLRITTTPLHAQTLPCQVVATFADITEHHLVAERLRLGESQQRAVLGGLREGVVLLDATGKVMTSNPSAERVLGLSSEQMFGLVPVDPGWRTLHEDGSEWSAAETPAQLALQTGDAQLERVMGVDVPEEGRRWLLVNAVPRLDASGDVIGVIASYLDITERRAAEAAVEEARNELATTLEALGEGVVLYDASGEPIYSNPSARLIIQGREPQSGVPGAPVTRRLVVDADGRPLERDRWPLVRARERGEVVRGEIVGSADTEDGEVLWLQANATPIVGDRRSGPYPVVVSFSDISERRAHDRALQLAQSRFRTAFESSPIGMAMIDLEGRFREVNPALSELVGRAAEDLVGAEKIDITHPEDREQDRRSLRELLDGSRPRYRTEKRYLHALGHAVWVQVDACLVSDPEGRPEFILAQVQDISERRRHQAQLEHLADHDMLTGLLNRRGFERELERQVAHAQRYRSGGALMMLDLDHFKYVNDTLGHKAGDDLIVDVADLLRARLRATDVVARLGGDEFAILLPAGGLAGAGQAAESVLVALRDRPPVPGADALKVTASIGIATLDAAATAEELLVCADLAMYDAKEDGRNGWAAYSTQEHESPKIKARMDWIDRIRVALDRDGFRLMAQPIASSQSGEPVMHELLVRMVSPSGELIPPATFLYIAERFDLVQEIDAWVVDQACGLLGRARAEGRRLALTANISGKSLGDPAVLAVLESGLRAAAADPSSLVLEITETSAISQIHQARAFAERVKELGCGLAIDDFGAGFGSFYYLKHLPYDLLKIDGEFVQGGPSNRADALIVDAVRDLAHGMGRRVVAEFVADAEIRDWLTHRGVDLLQGYEIGRPIPVEDAFELLPAAD